jgi:hypothetical protein
VTHDDHVILAIVAHAVLAVLVIVFVVAVLRNR